MQDTRLDPDVPSAARIYDYFLGGSHNFPADRDAARRLLAANPDTPLLAQVNRSFLRRVVRFLGTQGIDQFLDIGSGIPTVGNVHEIARRNSPAARVAYVDIDPVAVQHSLAILRDVPAATAIRADAREPHGILTHPEVSRLLDFDRPIALLLLAVLHFIPADDEAYSAVNFLREALPPGSYIAIAHPTYEGMSRASVERMEQVLKAVANPSRSRWRAEVLPFFEGLDLVEPGLVYAPLWRPERPNDLLCDAPERSSILAGVARKPGNRGASCGPRAIATDRVREEPG